MKAYFADLIITEKESINDAYLLEDYGRIVGIVKELNFGALSLSEAPITVVSYEGSILAPGLC